MCMGELSATVASLPHTINSFLGMLTVRPRSAITMFHSCKAFSAPDKAVARRAVLSANCCSFSWVPSTLCVYLQSGVLSCTAPQLYSSTINHLESSYPPLNNYVHLLAYRLNSTGAIQHPCLSPFCDISQEGSIRLYITCIVVHQSPLSLHLLLSTLSDRLIIQA